jgi:hypothetical protein
MAVLPTECPSCHGPVTVAKLACGACGTALEGTFELPALLALSPDNLEFVVRFIRHSGSLKAMAKEYGQSYPTIRNRLDDIIQALGDASVKLDAQRHSILDSIAKGTLSVDAAEQMLKGLAR